MAFKFAYDQSIKNLFLTQPEYRFTFQYATANRTEIGLQIENNCDFYQGHVLTGAWESGSGLEPGVGGNTACIPMLKRP